MLKELDDVGTIQKVFYSKDVFYNNGIVNLNIHINEHKPEMVVGSVLEDNCLVLEFDRQNEEALYNCLLRDFIDLNNIVYHTDNYRWYWDEHTKNFIMEKKFDVKGAASGNDVRHGAYSYISASQTGVEVSNLYGMFLEFAKANGIKEKDARAVFIDQKTDKLKSADKVKLVLYISKKQASENFSRYCISGSEVVLDSKIHQFEDGGYCFRDMLYNKNNYINKWDALIYWYGSRIKRFYNSNFFMYMNSHNLKSLYSFKSDLHMDNEIDDVPREYRDDKTGKLVKMPTNINIYNKLQKDDIKNPYFYISKSEPEFELKFFMYLSSHIRHIQENYESFSEDNRRKLRKRDLYESLNQINFLVYTEDGNMKSGLSEYTKAYKLILMLKDLADFSESEVYLFKYLADLTDIINMSKSQKEHNSNIKSFCENVLNFRPLRKNYFNASYDILKNNSRGFGKSLYYFESLYLKLIGRSEKEMEYHIKSKGIGEEIGSFCANIKDEDLLFKLRNIKNHKQFITYFKDLKFSILKNTNSSKHKFVFSREFNSLMEEIFDTLEKSENDWEIVRDYMAIYAIDKYKSVSFAIEQKGGV